MGQVWNPSQYNDPAFAAKMDAVYKEPDEDKRKVMIREMTREIVDKAPYLWLPTPYSYTAWWPWVKNYGGELRAGSVRPGPIYARIWVDQEMKGNLRFKILDFRFKICYGLTGRWRAGFGASIRFKLKSKPNLRS